MRHKKSCGIIPVHKVEGENLFLIVQQTNDSFSFPKGEQEKGESDLQTALREFSEETGIHKIDIVEDFKVVEEYIVVRDEGKSYGKEVHYFLGFVENNVVVPQESEIQSYKWATFEEANKLIQYSNRREVLRKAKEFLLK